jgi:uncharacterized membrane protein YdjX (TVP38/TMEM64 family)
MWNKKEILGGIFVVILFGGALLGAERFEELAQNYRLLTGPWGMVLYVSIAFIATVAAPFSAMPLLPLASSLWGPLVTALLSIAGWTAGSVVAFLLAKWFGKSLVGHMISLEKAERFTHKLTGTDPFWQLVLLRMLVPVDVLSYVVGLFVHISLLRYTIATILGITPFAFIFAYTSFLPAWTQVVVVGGAFVLLVLVYVLRSRTR